MRRARSATSTGTASRSCAANAGAEPGQPCLADTCKARHRRSLRRRGYDDGVGASPARLVIALSVAAALAIFVVYTALAGAGVAAAEPEHHRRHAGDVLLVGKVVGPVQQRRARGRRLRFG